MHKNLFGEGGPCGSAERFCYTSLNTQRKDGLGRQGIGPGNKVCKQAPCLTNGQVGDTKHYGEPTGWPDGLA